MLALVTDPRRTKWRRHPVGFVLAVALSGFSTAGFASLSGVAQWAAQRSPSVLARLGGVVAPLTRRIHPPSASTLARVLGGIDAEELTRVCVAWTLAHLPPEHATSPAPGPSGSHDPDVVGVQDPIRRGQAMAKALRGIALDGKAVRGARRHDGSMPHLMAGLTHRERVVVAQRQIPDKTSEIRALPAVLADLGTQLGDLSDTVLTIDALHTQTATAQAIIDAGASYVMTVKANQPTLLAACAQLIATAIADQPDHRPSAKTAAPGSDITRAQPRPISHDHDASRGHGRTEERITTTIAIRDHDGIDFPGAAQIARITRYTGRLDGQRTTKEIAYIITALPPERANATTVAILVRGHWQVENGLHWCRDVTFSEDASTATTSNLPAVLATIRNTVISAMRLAGATNIAATRRWAAANPRNPIRLFTTNTNLDIKSL